jgi:hypothetical protein
MYLGFPFALSIGDSTPNQSPLVLAPLRVFIQAAPMSCQGASSDCSLVLAGIIGFEPRTEDQVLWLKGDLVTAPVSYVSLTTKFET